MVPFLIIDDILNVKFFEEIVYSQSNCLFMLNAKIIFFLISSFLALQFFLLFITKNIEYKVPAGNSMFNQNVSINVKIRAYLLVIITFMSIFMENISKFVVFSSFSKSKQLKKYIFLLI